jgi:hypothetical protein
MQAIEIAQPLVTEPPGRQPFSVFHIIYMTLGGLLTVVWSGVLTICTYDIVSWLFG